MILSTLVIPLVVFITSALGLERNLGLSLPHGLHREKRDKHAVVPNKLHDVTSSPSISPLVSALGQVPIVTPSSVSSSSSSSDSSSAGGSSDTSYLTTQLQAVNSGVSDFKQIVNDEVGQMRDAIAGLQSSITSLQATIAGNQADEQSEQDVVTADQFAQYQYQMESKLSSLQASMSTGEGSSGSSSAAPQSSELASQLQTLSFQMSNANDEITALQVASQSPTSLSDSSTASDSALQAMSSNSPMQLISTWSGRVALAGILIGAIALVLSLRPGKSVVSHKELGDDKNPQADEHVLMSRHEGEEGDEADGDLQQLVEPEP